MVSFRVIRAGRFHNVESRSCYACIICFELFRECGCLHLDKPGKAVQVTTLGNDELFFTSIASAGQALGLTPPIDQTYIYIYMLALIQFNDLCCFTIRIPPNIQIRVHLPLYA
jgi:hypothetical protein